jgi:hypothetical protein
MTQDPVDQLLEDLDTALSVQPSPAVAAQVRRRMDAHSRSVGHGFRWWAGAAVAAAAVLVTSYATLDRSLPESLSDERPAGHEPRVADAVAAPPRRATAAIEGRGRLQPSAPAETARRSPTEAPGQMTVWAESEPDVVVSPADRLGFEQLQAAVSSGRITAETLASAAGHLEPTIVIPTILAVHQTPALGNGPVEKRDERAIDGTDLARPGGPRLVPDTDPPSYTRSDS